MRVWDTDSWTETLRFSLPGDSLTSALAVSADGKRVGAVLNKALHVWDVSIAPTPHDGTSEPKK